MKIFIINLKKDTEKKAAIEALCKQHNLNYEIIEAVYGFNLEEEFIHSITDKEQSIKEIGRELSKGEIGCTLSHLSIYKKIISLNLPYALVLEDDAFFNNELVNHIKRFNDINIEWDCILLGYYLHHNKPCNILIENNYKINNYVYNTTKQILHGTHGYIINKQGAQKLLNYNQKITLPIDSYTGNQELVNTFFLSPRIIEVNNKFTLDTELELDRKNLRLKYSAIKILDKLDLYKQSYRDYKLIVFGKGSLSKKLVKLLEKNKIYKVIDSDYNLKILKEENFIIINTVQTKKDAASITNKIKNTLPNSIVIDTLK